MMAWTGGGMDPFGWLGMAMFWLAALTLIVWLVGRLLPGSRGGALTRPTDETALKVLDSRLANGEIDMAAWQAQRGALLAAQGDENVTP